MLLRLQNAILFLAYTVATPPLHYRCLRCLPPLPLHIITAAAPPHHLRYMSPLLLRITSATSPLPLCLHCLSFSKRLPSEPLHPTHHRTTSDGKPSPLGIAGATHQWPPAAFTTPLPTTTLSPLHPDTDR
ncbi:hypothetical protein RHGRI_007240 [Rhododendron griersonianum]|uniref:Secreted protein n=1 Tax=Rhododendron griersonianum TaxID=479676 RepID=A0AAV6KZ65_9ERIC|nr:hypothetical protein RHGRI_007240 [Rhododendron griersonianum]